MKRETVFRILLRVVTLAAMGWAFAGCGGSHDDHGDHDHGGHGHAHEAPHGGALGMLGNHAFQIEILPQPASGRIDLYVLDGGAERFVRIAATAIDARAKSGEREWDLRFEAVANEATGETVGNSAHFVAYAAGLAVETDFEIMFDRLELLGQVFSNVTIPFPEGSH